MDKEQLKGSVELIILALISKNECYGGSIVKEIFTLSNEEYHMSEGTLYSVLKRLERKDYIEAYWGDESLGGRRKYYSITDSGKVFLREKLVSWRLINHIIENSIKE